jgi:hypothetical protein
VSPTIDLEDARLKLSRALYVYSELDAIARFGGEEPVVFADRWNPLIQGHDVIYMGPDLAVEASLIAGDFVHNVRSALDLIVAASVRASNARVTRNHSFPFYESEEEFHKKAAKCLSGVNEEYVSIFKKYQVFETQPSELNVLRSALVKLHRFWNNDKHRWIQSAGLQLISPGIAITVDPPFRITRAYPRINLGGRFKEGDTLESIEMVFPPSAQNESPKLTVRIASRLAFFDKGGTVTLAQDLIEGIYGVQRLMMEFDPAIEMRVWDTSYRSRQDEILLEVDELVRRARDPEDK